MANGELLRQLLATIQARRQERGLDTPLLDNVLGGPQTPAPAAQPAPASPLGPMAGNFIPQARPGGPTPSAMASMMPMQRPYQPSVAAAVMPMARPGSGAVPMPPPNPERLLDGAPLLAQGGPAAPVIPVEQSPLGPPGWRPAANTPPTYGAGMAVPRGTSGSIGDVPVRGGFDNLIASRYAPSFLSMDTAQRNYNNLPVEQRRNIEVMNMQQLEDFVNSADPSGPELRRVQARLNQLRLQAEMMGIGIGVVGNPLQGAPMLQGPGV